MNSLQACMLPPNSVIFDQGIVDASIGFMIFAIFTAFAVAISDAVGT